MCSSSTARGAEHRVDHAVQHHRIDAVVLGLAHGLEDVGAGEHLFGGELHRERPALDRHHLDLNIGTCPSLPLGLHSGDYLGGSDGHNISNAHDDSKIVITYCDYIYKTATYKLKSYESNHLDNPIL